MNEELTAVIYRGNVVPDYYINRRGELFSSKKSGDLIQKKVGRGCKYNPYPKYSISIEGKPKSVMVHRLVCETFHEKPIPIELKDIDWSRIPQPERIILYNFATHADRYQVNHIDHNINNFNAENLEWVTVKENQQKYQEHKVKYGKK